jgi:hypothetical protein
MKKYCLIVGLLFALPALANAQGADSLQLVQTIPLPNVIIVLNMEYFISLLH